MGLKSLNLSISQTGNILSVYLRLWGHSIYFFQVALESSGTTKCLFLQLLFQYIAFISSNAKRLNYRIN